MSGAARKWVSKLITKTRRRRLETRRKPYFVTIDHASNLAIGYIARWPARGTWVARRQIGRKVLASEAGSYSTYEQWRIGDADDDLLADGLHVFTFEQAKARAAGEALKGAIGTYRKGGPTVGTAADFYLNWYRTNRKAYAETKNAIEAHILPAFGSKLVSHLRREDIRRWHEDLANNPPRRRGKAGSTEQHYGPEPDSLDKKRARKVSANRTLTILKAILNKAYQERIVPSDSEWKVKPFGRVNKSRIRFLTTDEAQRLINASTPDFRLLVKAALFTGARYGELTHARVSDVDFDTRQLYISESKSGLPRYIPLHDAALDFFRSNAAGKTGQGYIFTKKNGQVWGRSHQQIPMEKACTVARIEPKVTFHDLRHTYASTLAQRGTDLLTISRLLGHANIQVTAKHYAHLCDKTLSDAVCRSLPDFGHEFETKIAPLTRQRSRGGRATV